MKTELVRFNSTIIDLRKICYEKYNYGGQEIIDYDAARTLHICCYDDKNTLVGCSRIVEGPYLPFDRVYKTDRIVKKSDIEIGRVCIAPTITNPLQKFKILSAMVKRAIAICIIKNCHTIYAGATSSNKYLYNKLVGFEEIHGPAAYYPATEGIHLLALNFEQEYNKRKRGIFNVEEVFLVETEKQLGIKPPIIVSADGGVELPGISVVFPKTKITMRGKIKMKPKNKLT